MHEPDRKALGKNGMTAKECCTRADHREEILMHNQYRGFLFRMRLRQYIYASPNKRSPLPPGWPDFTVFGPVEKVLFIEFKTERGTLSEDQRQVMSMLAIFGHTVYIERSYEQARKLTLGHFDLCGSV
jgi:VRR-NUC domain